LAVSTRAFAAFDPKSPLRAHTIERRAVGPRDVAIEILWSGVCHSDIHQARDEWGGSKFPMVPGHEIIGRVTKVGAGVKKVKVGELAGIGCMVDSCRVCPQCERGTEQYCEDGASWTYNSFERDKTTPTYGGYSTDVVVDEAFALRIDPRLDPASAAPLLCAGVTMFSPLRHWDVKPGQRVGVIGLGGLGHMAVKLARAMGAEVTVFSTSEKKRADAIRLGASELVVSSHEPSMGKLAGAYDLVLDTVSAPHDLSTFTRLLKTDATLVLLGIPDKPFELPAGSLIGRRRSVAGSVIGGIAETQEMLDFCAEHGVTADVEIIPIEDINLAYERMLKSDVRYRFVIDVDSLRK